MKLGLLLTPLPLCALLLAPRPALPGPNPRAALTVANGLTADERACMMAGERLGHEKVRVAWTTIRTFDGDIEASYCVLRGDPDASLEFARNAERVQFTLIGRGTVAKQGTYTFLVHTTRNRTIELGPAAILVQPHNRLNCRIEICQAFTDPGERVKSVDVLSD